MSAEPNPRTPPPGEPMARPGEFYRIAWIFYLLLAVAGVLWLGWSRGEIPLDRFLVWPELWLDALLGLAAGGFLLLLWELGRRRLAGIGTVETQLRQLVGPLTPSEALAIALVSGFAEELFFRGAMQASWGWPVATLIFALMHTGAGKPLRAWTAFALVAGALFAALTEIRGNILAPILGHQLVNAVNLYRLARGPSPVAGR